MDGAMLDDGSYEVMGGRNHRDERIKHVGSRVQERAKS